MTSPDRPQQALHTPELKQILEQLVLYCMVHNEYVVSQADFFHGSSNTQHPGQALVIAVYARREKVEEVLKAFRKIMRSPTPPDESI